MNKINLWYQKLLICFLLIGLLFIVYRQVVYYDFINYDDQLYVTNFHIQNGINVSGIVWVFTSSHAANWHPLTSLSLMLDREIFGLSAGGYHLTNLLFHIVNTLLLFFLFNKMTGTIYRSFFVAALFALHPLHVESVAWISARKDVLSAFFWLLTIGAYALYVKHPGIKRYSWVLIFFILGLMSKPMVVTLPFVLLLLDYWPLNRFPSNDKMNETDTGTDQQWKFKLTTLKKLVIEKIPLFILTLISCLVTYLVQKQAGAVATAEHFPLGMRIDNAIISYARYIEKTVLPWSLSVYYPHPGMWPIGQVILVGSLIILISILICKKSDRHPYLPVGWLWYLGTLVPVIGIVQVGSQAMADRYSYIPLIGLFVIVAWGTPELMKNWQYKKAVLGFSSILIIVILSIMSWQRCQLWGDSFALWNDVLKKYNISSPDNIKKNYKIAFAYNYRGTVYAEKEKYQKAIENYNMALIIDSKYAEALNNRAIVYGTIGQNELAYKDFAQVIKLKSNFADAYYNRGLLNNALGRHDLAVVDFSSAIKLEPVMADAFLSRGIAFCSIKQYDKALADFNKALIINRNFYQAYFNRGLVYRISKQYDLAIADFTEALRIKPDNMEAARYLRDALKTKSGLR